jgi:hypothetical protein
MLKKTSLYENKRQKKKDKRNETQSYNIKPENNENGKIER